MKVEDILWALFIDIYNFKAFWGILLFKFPGQWSGGWIILYMKYLKGNEEITIKHS